MAQQISTMKLPPQLIRYDAACRALAEAKAVDEVQDVRNKADAMRIYGMQAKNKTLEVNAAEIRIRAERRLGQLLSEQKAGPGLNTGAMGVGKSAVPSVDRTPTLAEVGIDKNLSSRAQKLAAVPHEEFETEVKEWRGRVEIENARVVTRLEKAGDRAAEPQDDDHGGPSLADLVDELQAENTRLTALLKTAEADDLVAEATKWRSAYDRSLTSQSEAMDAASRSEKREKFNKKQLMRCGKAVGCDDPTKIPQAVEAMAKRAASCK